MNISQLFSILRARWITCVSVFFGTIAVVVILSLVLPKKYKAEGSVVVLTQPDPITAGLYGAMIDPSIIATQADILTSDRVTRRVIHNLKLDQNPSIRADWKDATDGEGTVEDWLTTLLQKQLDVKPSRESNVITVTYKASDPKFAAGIVNAFIQADLDTNLELRVDPARQYSGFFVKQNSDARAALEAAQRKLSDYQMKNGISSSDERFDVEGNKLNDLAAQLVQLQAQSADSTSRQTQANNGNSDRLPDTMSNPVVQGLKVNLSQAQAKLEELRARYGENYPEVQSTKATIAELGARIAAETRRVAGSMTVSNTISRAREAEVRSQLDAQRVKVMALKQQRDQASGLQAEVDNANRNLQAVSQRLSQSSLESQTQQSNVGLLSPATPPIDPSFPKLFLNIILSVFLGAMFAVAFAMFREMRDRRVRSTGDLLAALGLPVLGVLPRPVTRKRGVNKPNLMAQRVISGRLAAPEKK